MMINDPLLTDGQIAEIRARLRGPLKEEVNNDVGSRLPSRQEGDTSTPV